MKVIFLGTPDFAAKVLEGILASRHEVVGVVTQPDRINARGKKITASPVKELAIKNSLPLFQFANISKEGEEELRALGADIMVTAAYGQILRENILELCPHGVINAHASLLPYYRGSSPVQWAVVNGERTLGVTIMQTERGVDCGDMLMKSSIELTGEENSEEALSKLAEIGAPLTVRALDEIESGTAVWEKQDNSKATYCRMLKREDGKLDFHKSADGIVNFVRGMNPWPGAFTDSEFGVLKITRARKAEGFGRAGEIISSDPKKGLIVACGDGCVEILRVKAEGGKEMEAKAFLLGHRLKEGSILGE